MESEKTDNTKSFDLRDDAPSNERSAGILLHITSLPSLFGIGDFGPEARSFADFLHRSGQKYWQILPLNPTDISPYSAHSSLAGHTLLISPEWFLQYGFLEEEDIIAYTLPVHDNINIEEAIQVKTALFKKAYRKYLEFAPADMEMEFQIFCEEESHWLTDFGLYTLLKKNFQSSAWFA